MRTRAPRRLHLTAVVVPAMAAMLTSCASTDPGRSAGDETASGNPAPDATGVVSAGAPFDPSASSHFYPPERDIAGGSPLIVLVPGGGWTAADPTGLGDLASWLAQHGAAVVTVTYRTSSEGVYFPQSAADISCGVASALAQSQDAGVNVSEVVVVGHSAGAQLAAVVALTPEAVTADCAAAPVAADRFIGLAGPYDVNKLGGVASEIFGPDKKNTALWDSANPVLLAAERPDLPVLLVHGVDDDVVPVAFSEQFAAALVEGGHPVAVEYPEGVDHASVYSAEVAGPIIASWLGLGD